MPSRSLLPGTHDVYLVDPPLPPGRHTLNIVANPDCPTASPYVGNGFMLVNTL